MTVSMEFRVRTQFCPCLVDRHCARWGLLFNQYLPQNIFYQFNLLINCILLCLSCFLRFFFFFCLNKCPLLPPPSVFSLLIFEIQFCMSTLSSEESSELSCCLLTHLLPFYGYPSQHFTQQDIVLLPIFSTLLFEKREFFIWLCIHRTKNSSWHILGVE